jgi:hypothetical protein
MEAIELLKRDALIRRNAAILKAKRDYHKELKAIKTLGRSLGVGTLGRPRKVVATENPLLKPLAAVREILAEGKPMTTTELTIEAMRRGCRSADDHRDVARAINAVLSYHRRHFERDERGRWLIHRH